ncbi:unnamed protein product [Diplocarpon coronariae]|uniref:Uncharacterized protein n=1 Tax=Diplocarpon coronariae TaxID=2795749 RepID=A0A218Z075_9HELO|nr:hypothetical protein JHW43_005934 [Diplocarpon mali]OWP01471.1 hypothetical protein B2J93_703 [Marssonina coronariae]
MSRRVANLPTGRVGAPMSDGHLPQYLAHEAQLSGDSTGSQESILTQVPMSFHMSQHDEHYGAQQQQMGGEIPFVTPDMTNPSTFASMGMEVPRMLNPNSAPFAAPHGGYDFFGKTATGYSAAPANIGSNSYNLYPRGQYHGDARIGPIPSYSAPNVYSQGVSVQGENGGQYAPQSYGAASNANSYGNFGRGQAAAGNGFGGYAASSASLDHGNSYSTNSNYAPSSSNHQGFRNNPHGGNSAGYADQRHVNYHYQSQYAVQAPQVPYVHPSNANRGKPGVFHSSKLNISAPSYNPSANLATAPVHSGNKGRQTEHENHGIQKVGAIQTPSRLNSASPMKSRPSTRNSSEKPSSSIRSEDKNSAQGSLDPTPIARPLQEFKSEPNNSKTPTLRSRRGQTVVPSTDPVNKAALHSWLESVTPISNGPAAGEKLRSPPPQMMDLFNSGGIDSKILTPTKNGVANEADPFTGPRATPAPHPLTAVNPFAPAHAVISPYSGPGLLLGPPSMSGPLRRITNNGTGKPSFSEAIEAINLPFIEYCRTAREDTWGVVRIKNIPYSVNRPEVLAFLGRNARIISEQDFEPVHIVMERVTSKTLDCYVEFVNFNEAVNAVNRFETNRTGGRGGRLGQRHVEVELSSQEQLMKDLFPKAKNVTWAGSKPMIKARDLNDPYNSGFQGFISKEELVMLVKHVEAPQRSPFSKDCPQRPFECLISTLLKYPWYMVDFITIEDRNFLHKVTLQLIGLLQERIQSEHENINLTPMLLKRVWRAALKCPGFSPSQKDDIAYKCGIDDQFANEMGVPSYAPFWKDLWTIGPKPGAPTDLILYYAAIIREAVGAKVEMSLAEKAARGLNASAPPSLFGELISLVGFPKDMGNFTNLTLAQCAAAEWTAIENALRRALTPALAAA